MPTPGLRLFFRAALSECALEASRLCDQRVDLAELQLLG